jgi:hypothetical protein
LAAGCGTTVDQSAVGTTPGGTEAGLSAPGGTAAGSGTTPGAPGTAGGAPITGGSQPGATAGTGGTVPGQVPGMTTSGGATRDTSSLTIGLTYINNQSASSSLGANDPRANAVREVVQAFVRALNKSGGVAGRKLQTVEYEWHSGDGSWSTAASAACAKFTQDHHVSIVLDEAFGEIGGFRDCLQRHGVFDITNQDEGDDVGSGQATLHVNPGGMTYDRSYGAVLRAELASGYLTKSSQLGILVEECPQDVRAYNRTLAPLIRQLGLKEPKRFGFECVDSTAGGAGNGSAAISNAILHFRTAPVVDRVMFVSAQEAAALLLFGPQASSQNYHPGYLLSSAAQAHLFVGGGQPFPSDQLPGLHGVGNSPFADVNDAKPTAADRRCLTLLKSAGLSAGNYDDKGQAVFSCAPFLFLDALLTRTNGVADPGLLANAAAGLGTSFASPGVLAGSTRFTSTQHDGGYAVQTFAYQPGCECMRYTGKPTHA